MKSREVDNLMNEVLDGVASPEEARELDRLLAADPAAQARFQDLERVFSKLDRVPGMQPPPGLKSAVMERVAGAPSRGNGRIRTLFRSGIDRLQSSHSRTVRPGQQATTDRGISRLGPFFGGEMHMSQQEKNPGNKRKFIIGSGIAAAAAVVIVAQYGFDFSGTDNAAGTIAPAQRYRATQGTGSDVKTGTNPSQQTGGTPVTDQTGPAVANQGLNSQGLNNQGLNNQGLNNQGMNNQGLNSQGLNNQGLNNQG